jgi:hypothetical protein
VGQETRERPEDAIGGVAVEAGDEARQRHKTSATEKL